MKRIVKLLSAVLIACTLLCLSACSGASLPPEDGRSVGTANGRFDITYDLYKYFYLNYAATYKASDFEGENRTATEAELRTLCKNALINVFATQLWQFYISNIFLA